MLDLQTVATDVLSQFRLDGRVAFLTGATGHLGQSMARGLAGAGAHVVLNARRQDALEDLATDLISSGHRVSIACFDITDESAARIHIAKIAEQHGRLDGIGSWTSEWAGRIPTRAGAASSSVR
jgi:gluconate 5-dehydrogenase